MENKIKVLIKRPDEQYGYMSWISNTLANMQRTVDGYIQAVTLSDDIMPQDEKFPDKVVLVRERRREDPGASEEHGRPDRRSPRMRLGRHRRNTLPLRRGWRRVLRRSDQHEAVEGICRRGKLTASFFSYLPLFHMAAPSIGGAGHKTSTNS